MKPLKIIREILFYLNNIIQFLIGAFLILAGIAGIAAGVWAVIYSYNDSGEWAGIVFVIVLPIVIGVAVQVLIPLMAVGFVCLFPILFAIARIIVKDKTAKFIFAVMNIIGMLEFSVPCLGVTSVGLFVYVNIAVVVVEAFSDYMTKFNLILILTSVAIISILIPLLILSLQISLLSLTACIDIIELYYEYESKKALKDKTNTNVLEPDTAKEIATG